MPGTTRLPGFTRTQIALHWLIAALVLVQLLFGESMVAVIEGGEEGTPVSAGDAFLGSLHFWFGIAILGLVALRLIVRLRSGTPPPAVDTHPVMQFVATATHWLFYALLVVVPILGLMAFYLGDPWGELHALAKPVFIVLIGLHAGAALFHQFVLRDGTLGRMLVPARSAAIRKQKAVRPAE